MTTLAVSTEKTGALGKLRGRKIADLPIPVSRLHTLCEKGKGD